MFLSFWIGFLNVLILLKLFRDVYSPAVSMVVLVYLTMKNKPFPVRARSLGLETDAKLRKVIIKSTFYSILMCKSMSNPHKR